MVFVYQREAIQQPLEWPQYRIEKCPFAIENLRHEYAHRLGNHEYHGKVQKYLQPAI